ncbi:MAG: hypothetical protein ACREJD_02890 [Phycisphaerales bacterium]
MEDDFEQLRDQYEFGANVGRLSPNSRRELRAYQERLTAFIDIIGFAELVRRMKDDKSLQDRLLAALRKLAEQNTSATDVGMIGDKRVNCFSDSIVISYPYYHPGDFTYLLQDILLLTIEMACLGFAIRGAITMAPLHQTPGIVIGEALIDAYFLERNVARNPRVIASPGVMRIVHGVGEDTSDALLEEWIEAGKQDARNSNGQWVGGFPNMQKDDDGHYFLDHLGATVCALHSTTGNLDHLSSVRGMIVSQLDTLALPNSLTAEERAKRFQKWQWYRRYFNSAASRYGVAPVTLT